MPARPRPHTAPTITEISPVEEGSTKVEKEITRSEIALYYILGFILIVAGVILIGVLKGYTVNENKDMLLSVSAVLSGPLGFIIGYYFKSEKE